FLGADLQSGAATRGACEIVGVDFDLARRSIHVELDARGFARSIVCDSHVVEAALGEALLTLNANAAFAGGQSELNVGAALQVGDDIGLVETQLEARSGIVQALQNGYRMFRGGLDPDGDGERLAAAARDGEI